MFLNLLGVQCFKKSQLREYKVGHRHNTSDFVSPDDFDDVEVIFFYLQDFHSQCLQLFNLYIKMYLRHTYLKLYTTDTYTTCNTFTYNAFLMFLH